MSIDFQKIFKSRKTDIINKSHLASRYYFELLSNIQSMLTFSGLPETCRENYLKMYSIENGLSCVHMVNGELWAFRCTISGKVDFNGIGDTVVIEAPGFSGNFNIKDVPILWNNSLHTPDMDIIDYTKQLIDIDISEKTQVVYSRLFPSLVANNEKQVQQYQDFINNLVNGKYSPILSKKSWTDLDETERIEIVNLTDNSKIDKIQYLSMYRDQIMKRFWNKYGQAIQNTGKMAQTLNDEIHANDWISIIYPLDKLKCAEDFCKQANSIYNLNVSVDFSDPWKYKIESMLKNVDNSTRVENGVDSNETQTDNI